MTTTADDARPTGPGPTPPTDPQADPHADERAEERAALWARDNQRYLVLHAEAVAARLDGRPGDAARPERAAAQLAEEVVAAAGAPVAPTRIAQLFGLTRFEQDILVAAAAPELGLPRAAGTVTFARALAALPDAHWSALLPDAPLRHWRLADLPGELPAARYGGLPQLPLSLDERVLHALVGAVTLDERLRGRARLAEPVCALSPRQREVAGRLAALAAPSTGGRPGGRPLVLTGEDRLTRRQAVLAAASSLGLTTLLADAWEVPPDAPTADLYGRILAREAALGGRLLLVEAGPPGTGPSGALSPAASVSAALADAAGEPPPGAVRLAADAAGYGVPVVLSLPEPPGTGSGTTSASTAMAATAAAAAAMPVLRLPPAGPEERRALFARALADAGLPAPAGLTELADRHPLTAATIALGVERAARLTPGTGTPGTGTLGTGTPSSTIHGGTTTHGSTAAAPTVEDLAAACRTLTDRPLHGLAQLRRPATGLASMVLAEPAERALRALLAQVRQRHRVHEEWGHPGGAGGRGLAVTALFSGPSGTGKTTAAEALAGELGRDVLRADLGQLVSKYIGETEKNLARLFDAAEAGAVLVFDEGDSLFGRRTTVRDSRDRYANLEVSFLLQRLESFAGICVVTTNAKEALDSAFLRRMRFVVNFPFPDAEQRAGLWRRAFPPGVPVDGLDPVRLAQLAVTGGSIAQLALHAAFLAADAGEPVRMAHVREAVRIECEKLERPLSPHELRGWE
ncbi:AAA family ATPase [Kitasatospora sp. NPDC004240]